MAKISAIETNLRRQRLVARYAERRAELKDLISDQSQPPDVRFAATMALAKLPRNSSKTRVRNRCLVTGRPRAYYRKFKMSRIALRDLASTGMIPGSTS